MTNKKATKVIASKGKKNTKPAAKVVAKGKTPAKGALASAAEKGKTPPPVRAKYVEPAYPAKAFNISLLYTNDTHGHLQSYFADGTKPVGGISKRAILFEDKRRRPGMSWLALDSGDTISGTPLSDVFQGYLDVEAMNRLHYDAMTLGVHDFDYGVDVLRQRMKEAKFPILAANIVLAKDGTPFTKPYVIIQRGGAKIAILGLTTGELADRVDPHNFRGLKVLDPVDTAREWLPKLQSQADVIVALTHLGVNEDIHLASQVRGIDVIVGGLSHSELAVPMKVPETLVVQDAYYGRTVGVLKLSYVRTKDGIKRVYFDNSLEPLDGRWKENTEYLTWLSGYKAQMAERMGTLLGSTTGRFNAGKVKSSETEMGNFVTDVLRESTGSDVAILPAAFFRDGLPGGSVTLGDLYAALPFDHYAVVLTVTGGELQQILSDAANQIGKPGFPQVSGASFAIYNGHAPQSTIKVGGQDLNPFGTYTVATSDFLADGGLGYAAMGTIAKRLYTGKLIRDLVRLKINSGQPVSSKLYARITFLAQEPEVMAASQTPSQPEQPGTPGQPAVHEDGFIPDEKPANTAGAAASGAPAGEPAAAPSSPSEPAAGSTPPPVTDEPVKPEEPGGARPQKPEETPAQPSAEPESTPAGEHLAPSDQSAPPADEGTGAAPADSDNGGVKLNDEVVKDQDNPAPPESDNSTDKTPESTPAPPVGSKTKPIAVPDPLTGAKVLGSAKDSQGGLDYEFQLLRTKTGYQFRLVVSNNTDQPIELHYATGKRYDFSVFSGSELKWDYDHNRFFSQALISDSIEPHTKRSFGAEWDGGNMDKSPLPRNQSYRFEAAHFLSDAESPIALSFEATLP